MPNDRLALYKAKRDFAVTTEPSEGGDVAADALTFVVQKHWASHLHYDFRLELDGAMVSWAIPKGPSFDPKDKRMAVHVEDHPISYSSFEGTIPAGQYGAGQVIVWDNGTWHPVGDAEQGLRDGSLKFELRGHKLHGRWALVRMKGRGERKEPWLLIKEKDDFARPAAEFSVIDELPDSVLGTATSKADEPAPAPGKKSLASKKAKLRSEAPEMAAPVERVAKPRKAAPAPAAARSGPPEGARKSALPANFEAQLATLVDAPPRDHSGWVYEIKWDGYRILSRVEGDDIRLVTRNGNDWTPKLAALRKAMAELAMPDGWYDGEIVVLNSKGVPDFGELQNAFDAARPKSLVYFLFDAPYLAGYDLRGVRLDARRAALLNVLSRTPSDVVRFSEAFDAPPEHIVASACQLGLEGVIAKRRASTYSSTRTADWLKLKCAHRQEFVIGGWTDPKGSRSGVGSLLLGVYEDGKLRYAGNVGAGFDGKTLASTRAKLDEVAADASPFAPGDAIPGRPHWVAPRLVAEVTFGEWTSAGHIRHSVFHALRFDKEARTIVREEATSAPRSGKAGPNRKRDAASRTPALPVSHALSPSPKITHPERVIDESTGVTKVEVFKYYGLAGELMMEHLSGRPVSLVRAPAGVRGQLFFQKHAEVEKLPGVAQLPADLDADHPPMLEIASANGLMSAAQWNVIEIHTQNALAADYEHPDRIVFDLDPGDGVDWSRIQEAANLMRSFLSDLGLVPFLKTSGGKGLHVVVPLVPKAGWDEAKGFSKAVVDHVARTLPQMFVAKAGGKNRVGKIFIDWLRNGRGSTTACAWSARSRPGLGVSVPVGWDELGGLKGGDHWTVRSATARMEIGNAPWKAYPNSARTLDVAAEALGWRP